PLLLFHRLAGPVAHMLPQTGQAVEQSGFARVRLPQQGNDRLFGLYRTHVLSPPIWMLSHSPRSRAIMESRLKIRMGRFLSFCSTVTGHPMVSPMDVTRLRNRVSPQIALITPVSPFLASDNFFIVSSLVAFYQSGTTDGIPKESRRSPAGRR